MTRVCIHSPLALARCLMVVGLLFLSHADAAESSVATDVFEKRIRPLLAEHCVSCHGPEKQKGHLRLDSPAGIRAGGDGGSVLEPGQPEASRLIQAVQYSLEDLKMPPKRRLEPALVTELLNWVKAGAPMPATGETPSASPGRKEFNISESDRKHWSFQPLVRPAPPRGSSSAGNPIDDFIRSGLESHGLVANGRASRREMVRRAYFDLTGLPPTPEEVEAFVHDDSPRSWESLIDRLLESPHYGEKWGRHWLDLVRFAESNSYERDGGKPNAWRYRDYVIRSFNADKPYDRFLKEQLAGDELPDADSDSITATGFYRLGIWDDEPADRELARFDALDDIVATTGQVFLGLTVDCARCHHHKIDPISQHDYYRLVSFFRNVNHYRNGGPTDELPVFAGRTERLEFERKSRELESQRNEAQARVRQFEEQFRARLEKGEAAEPVDIEDLHFRFYRDTWETLPVFDSIKAESSGTLTNGLFDLSPRTRNTAFGFVFEGFLIVPKDGDYTFFLDSDDGARLIVDGVAVLAHDGIHTAGNEKSHQVSLRQGRRNIRLDYFQAREKFGLNVAWSGPGFERRSLSAPTGPRGNPAKGSIENLMSQIGSRVLGRETWAACQEARKALEQLKNKSVPVEKALAVTEAASAPPDTFVLLRGNPNLKGDKVEPGFLQVLGKTTLPTDAIPKVSGSSGRRTALANWITSPENPLTARVMVNRLWQHHFGRGIVRSPNNFGIQGDKPTHPELLDWLASELIANGWRLKPMHRMIMMSEAYQRSSRGNEDSLRKDPMNQAFWRFDMRRLTAEEIRDSILSLTGTLNSKMYGPGVYVEIPREVLAGQSVPGNGWGKSPPEEQARRSVYIYVKRSLITPILESFDVAETDRSAPSRFATVQPTQALGMLNGSFLHRQSELLAARLQREEPGSSSRQLNRAMLLAAGRPASESEMRRGMDLLHSLQQEEKFSETAALQHFCLLVLSLNELIYLD